MNFSIGDKVVCVDGKFPDTVKLFYAMLPVENKTYVIRAVRVGVKVDELLMDMRRVLEPSLLLIGLTNSSNNVGVEHGFAANRFRKLESLQAEAAQTKEQTDEVHA